MKSTLILGGARSGKSDFAQALAFKWGGAVLFVATAEAGDDEMKKRIEVHRRARPTSWETLEATTHIGRRVALSADGKTTVIIDCITLLISNVMQRYGDDPTLIEEEVTAEINELINCIDQSKARFIIVSNEVGLGLVPADRLTRLYRDLLGRANQMLARHANDVYLMVAGIPMRVKKAA